MKLFQLSVQYIEAYIGTCPLLSPLAKYYYGVSIFEDCRACVFSETSQVCYCNNFSLSKVRRNPTLVYTV